MPYELVPRKPQHPRMPPRWSAKPAPLTDQESYGFLVHEIRNLVNTAIVACEVMNVGKGASRDDAGRILKRSLSGLRQLVDGSIAEIRVRQLEAEIRDTLSGLPKRPPAAPGGVSSPPRSQRDSRIRPLSSKRTMQPVLMFGYSHSSGAVRRAMRFLKPGILIARSSEGVRMPTRASQ